MTIKFNKPFFATSLMLLSIEICIAAFLTKGFIRHTFGDYLVVILMYCALRSFIKIKPLVLGLSVLLFAYLIEFLQKFELLETLQLKDHRLATLILGSTFEVSDLIAYTLGVITILLIDMKFCNSRSTS